MTDADRWLSVEEIAAHLGVSKETIYRWLERKVIPAHRMGKLWRFQRTEVDSWVTGGGAAERKPTKSSKSGRGRVNERR
jgi:excisionase family DNA binding protein